MSGLDIPPVAFDWMRHQRDVLRAMAQPLLGPQGPGRTGEQVPASGEITPAAATFDGVLGDALAKVQGLQDDARDKVRGLALGEDVELHDVMIAANKSETAFSLLLEVRNKLVDAWEKLSRSVM